MLRPRIVMVLQPLTSQLCLVAVSIIMARTLQKLIFYCESFLKHLVNWNTVCTFHTLNGRIGKVVATHAEGCKIESILWLSCTDLYYARGAQNVVPMRVGGVTRQLDLLYRL